MRLIPFLIGFAIVLAIVTVVTALMVGCVNSWVMQDTFANGWSAAIDRWYITLGIGVLFGGLGSTVSKN